MDAARRKSGATYADIEALPDHVIGEIVDGDLYVSPVPPAGTRLPHRLSGKSSEVHFNEVAVAREDGGSSTNRSCTSQRTSWFPTSPAGDGSRCRSFPTPHSSR